MNETLVVMNVRSGYERIAAMDREYKRNAVTLCLAGGTMKSAREAVM